MKRLAVLVLAAALASLSLGSCALWYMVFGVPVSVKFKALPPGGARALSKGLSRGFTVPSTPVGDGTIEANFTPTSVLVPITGIGLENSKDSSQSSTLWETGDSSIVDIASQSSLDALSSRINQGANAKSGSYDSIQVHFGPNGGHPQIKIKGSVNVGGTVYYTSTGGPTQDINHWDYITISLSGSGALFPLSAGNLTVDALSSEVKAVSIFASVDGYAVAQQAPNGSPSGYGTGASYSSIEHMFMFANAPLLLAYAGDIAPGVENYCLIFNSAADFSGNNTDNPQDHGSGAIQLILGSDGEPIGAIAGPWSPGIPGWQIANGAFFTSVGTIKKQADGSYLIQNGVVDSSGLAVANSLSIPKFSRFAAVGDVSPSPLPMSYDGHSVYFEAKRVAALAP